MDAQKVLTADFDDLVFEGRNKSYGAYFLRKKYSRHLFIALLIASLLYVLGFATPYILSLIQPSAPAIEKKVIKTNTLAPPPPIDKNTPPPPKVNAPPPKKVVFTAPVIKPEDEVKEEDIPPPVAEIQNVEPSTDVDPNATYEAPPAPVEEAKPQIFTYVEQMPVFPGGEKAMVDFMSKNTKYPPAARENGITGRVVVQFVVDEQGNISDITVLRDIGGGCAEEAVRVVKMMPPWKPGKQNGNPVKVYFKLPFNFTLNAE